MCTGSHVSATAGGPQGTSPPLLDPWSKTQLGFIEPIVVDAAEHRLIDMYGMDAQGSYNVLQVISDVDPDQFFLLENRRMVGFDEPLSRSNAFNHGNVPRGDGGILIYHIDERVIRDERLLGLRRGSVDLNGNGLHRGIALEAMHTADSEDRNPANFNPFFVRDGLRYTFNESTTPNSNFHTPGLCNDHRRVTYDCHPQIVASGISIQVNSTARSVIEVEIGIPGSEPCCPIVAYGRFADQVGGEGLRGAPWELCECGVLTVSEGFINWTGTLSPWNAHRYAINEIIFTGQITAGTLLINLFRDLSNLTTIEGLEYFDTSRVTSMHQMFLGARSLTSLDLSNWDTGRVINMGSMFQWTDSLTELDVSGWDTGRVTSMFQMFLGARSLTSLDLSNWDMRRVTHSSNMRGMFTDTTTLRNLTLGENTRFIGLPSLPSVRATADFTGYWQNVGGGTVENPLGEYVLTSAQLMAQFDGATMADTWVWQPR